MCVCQQAAHTGWKAASDIREGKGGDLKRRTKARRQWEKESNRKSALQVIVHYVAIFVVVQQPHTLRRFTMTIKHPACRAAHADGKQQNSI